jgi:hypothetical protein
MSTRTYANSRPGLAAGHEDDESSHERIIEVENGDAIVEKIGVAESRPHASIRGAPPETLRGVVRTPAAAPRVPTITYSGWLSITLG